MGYASRHGRRIRERGRTVNTYTITTKSSLYTVYTVEAETEAEAREIVESSPDSNYLSEWSEDTHIAYVDMEEEE
jgi:hypothetical protein